MFTETTHVATVPPSFAWVVLALTWIYILSYIKIHLGVSEPQGVENHPSSLVWLVAYKTAYTTVQAVIQKLWQVGRAASINKLTLLNYR